MNFSPQTTKNDGNCSFSSLYRALHANAPEEDQRHEDMFILMQRFLFAYMNALRKRGPNKFSTFYLLLQNAYFLAEDELIYHALFVLNKFILIFRDRKDGDKLFIQPQFYDLFLRRGSLNNLICLSCNHSHYEYLQEPTSKQTLFSFDNLSSTLKQDFLPFTKIEDIPLLQNPCLPVCIQTESSLSKIVNKNKLHPKIMDILHPDLLQDIQIIRVVNVTRDEYTNLQNIVSSTFDIFPIRLNILMFLENDKKEYAVVFGEYSRKQLHDISSTQFMFILRFCVFLQTLADKSLCFSLLESIQNCGESIVLEFKENRSKKISTYIDARNSILQASKLNDQVLSYFKLCPEFNLLHAYMSEHPQELLRCSQTLQEAVDNSENDLQLLDELYLRS